MKPVIASTLALVISSFVAPAVHAQTDSAMTDQQLAHSVRVSFARSGVSLSHVFVFARSGQVTLVGWVPELTQVSRAEEAARSVSGVTSVDNRLSPDAGRI